jgi:hypothetical protein
MLVRGQEEHVWLLRGVLRSVSVDVAATTTEVPKRQK